MVENVIINIFALRYPIKIHCHKPLNLLIGNTEKIPLMEREVVVTAISLKCFLHLGKINIELAAV